MRGRQLTVDGVTKTISEWARTTGLTRAVIAQRLNKCKWSVKRAVTTPKSAGSGWNNPKSRAAVIAHIRKIDVDGVKLTVKEIAAKAGVTVTAINRRLRSGITGAALLSGSQQGAKRGKAKGAKPPTPPHKLPAPKKVKVPTIMPKNVKLYRAIGSVINIAEPAPEAGPLVIALLPAWSTTNHVTFPMSKVPEADRPAMIPGAHFAAMVDLHAKTPEELWIQKFEMLPRQEPKPYKQDAHYEMLDEIVHPTLGTGLIVGSPRPGRISVRFENKVVTLVCA